MVLICSFTASASAVVLHVGPSRTYTTIQAAIDAATDADEIIIYEANYVEDVTITNLNALYIHANDTDRVTVKGMFNLYNATSATWSDNNIIEGLIFDQSGIASGWCVQHQYARNNEYKHCIFMGDGSGANGIYGYLQYGLNIARHCTFYGLASPYSNGYAAGLHVFDSIIAFNTAQPYNATGYSGVASYSNYYNNSLLPVDVGDTTGTIFQDPQFLSTDPFDSDFLVLGAGSACIGTASDATDMGAFIDPVIQLLSSDPNNGESWPRQMNNQIGLVFSETLSGLPAVPLSIIKMGTMIEVNESFDYSLATTNQINDTLVATENGSVLEDKKRYRIEPVGGWTAQFATEVLALRGDLSSNGLVDLPDLKLLTVSWLGSGTELGNVDLDDNNVVNVRDYSILAGNWYQQEVITDPLAEVNFTKFINNPLLGPSPAPATDAGYTNHCCVRRAENGTYMMWYSAPPCGGCYPRQIHLATSSDGIGWSKQGAVLGKGSPGDFDEYQVHMPTVLWDSDAGGNGLWKMWYTGHGEGAGSPDYSGWQAIGYATSPDGINWTKQGLVLDGDPDPGAFDHNTLRSPAVIFDPDDNLYKIWYYGTQTSIQHYGPTGYAESVDGVIWNRYGQINEGESKYVTLEVLKINDVFYMWHNIGPYLGYSVSLDGISWIDDPDNPVLVPTAGTWDAAYLQGASCVYHADTHKLYLYYNAVTNYTENIERIGGAWTWFYPR